MIAIFVIDIFRNAKVKQNQKALWAVVIFFGYIIAMPIYWYLYIWKENSSVDVEGK